MNPQLYNKAREVSENIKDAIFEYLNSEGPGGKRIISAFKEEFEKLSVRSPKDDPTNIMNYIDFLVDHMKRTWDESLNIDRSGNVNVGICKDSVLGFDVDRAKLRHSPVPTAWVVYLIRGIGGRYAFVNPQMYFEKKGEVMPPVYAGGFLISKHAWDREHWDILGPFDRYEHPASGAPPIPFFTNVMNKVNMKNIVSEAIEYANEKFK